MFTKKPDRGAADDGVTGLVSDVEGPADYSTSAAPCILSEDLQITGNVISKGEIQIDGEIQGDIKCGLLLLGDKSSIVGSVVADDVIVRGRVLGSIRGLRVTLQAQSRVEGDIYHQSLAIEQGASFEGKSRRLEDPLAASPSSRSDTPEPPARPATTHMPPAAE